MKTEFRYTLWILFNLILAFGYIFLFLRYDNAFSDMLLFYLLLHPLFSLIISIYAFKKIKTENRSFKPAGKLFIISLLVISSYVNYSYFFSDKMGTMTTTYSIIDKSTDQDSNQTTVFDRSFNTELTFTLDKEVFDEIEAHPDIEYLISYRYAEVGEQVNTTLVRLTLHPVDNS
ncbi:hypothetical protein [Alkalibacterium pelagium]|uniref:Uncharacterized protein n=1 Tax=Alkalibacterium pelagium TaxID=426702 RepID=A0A1H7M2J3_9LACT|nr:hypothetical protein [Alkalibacterium pelagium]GEN51038.1 hypothetical protein APE02nite_17030 [Alkalibacterium pelagium]SEL05480.1 hypothetical protein SAMN04488099_11089 [Alkalibacterium pelagium]